MKKGVRNLLYFIFAFLATLALQCRHMVGVSSFSTNLLNGLNRIVVAFESPEFTDVFAMIGIFYLIRTVGNLEKKLDWSTVILSVVMSFLYVVMISFRNYGNFDFLIATPFQYLLSLVCVCGGAVILYCILRLGCIYLKERPAVEKTACTFVQNHLGKIGFFLIFVSWMAWILLNYPGTDCPDTIRQLSEYLGDEAWSAWHPPLSSLIMGLCFSVGRTIWNPNFGFFLYCFLQTMVGALVFSYSMKKLQKLGTPVLICIAGLFFFAFTPLWGVHAQWLDKDLLYAEITVLQTVCMVEVVWDRECTAKQAVILTATGILASLLRNNGIYAIVPTLVALGLWLKSSSRKRIIIGLTLTVVVYLGILGGLFPALGIQNVSVGETLSVPIQQTARYVSLYGDEVTEQEKEVLSENFHYDALYDYDPLISDPVKNHFTAGNLPAYFKVWWQMFLKHPDCYLAAYFAKSYGYLAPVEVHMEGWVGSNYSAYAEGLGLYHPFGTNVAEIPRQIMFLGEMWPILRYLCMPGTYTWLLIFLSFFLIRGGKRSALILFIPSYINVLVCTASPLHNALRYELPVLAVMPFLIGWSCCCLFDSRKQAVS